MDLVHDRASIITEEKEEDRISNLPDDIIHHILSFLDMKYAIQTIALSKKWKHIWTSMPHLNLNSETFPTLPQFAKFVKHALSHRNHLTEVSALELKFRGVPTHFSVKSVVKYAYSHNVKQMSMMSVRFSKKVLEFPQCLFSSHTLKHLTLATNRHYSSHMLQYFPKSIWDFPVLETLNLSNLDLDDQGVKSLDLFSKCGNLKDLTLHGCSMFGLDIFTVCAPLLSNLTITDPVYFPKVFNVVAPQLENLTTSVNSYNYYNGFRFDFLQLLTEGLDSLERVNLSVISHSYNKERFDPLLLNLFRKLRSAKFLILDKGIIQVLSSCLDQLLDEPCPFNNLKCLKIKTVLLDTMPTQAINYLLESSPNATLIMDLPQVSKKRSRLDEDEGTNTMAKVKVSKKRSRLDEDEGTNTMAKVKVSKKRSRLDEDEGTNTMAKVAKLEEEKRMKMMMQDEVIAEQKKTMVDAMMSNMINCNIAQLQVQVAGGNPDYELIRSIMELTLERLRTAMEAQFCCRYQEMKSLFLTHIDASQWAKIEMELGIADDVHNQLDVSPAAQLPSPSPSPNMATSSSIANGEFEPGTRSNILKHC